ncbi:CIC11C00000003703 [Sungouiella intermedia]|uniref:CIC11C00000003703 n=1 Tax=Sungouiella intermedia TaxID=45354 RepID=A0A1L0GSB5_9ASCO|nr:CIC11C00000003703 [[Candida] intermedia]
MTIHTSSVDQLVSRIEERLSRKSRTVIAIAGIPGAGKSTLVRELIDHLGSQGILAQLLPQDGYHYYRAELAKFEDSNEAFRRRGAPFTFNVERFLSAIEKLHSGEIVLVPLFDHSKKDPVEDDIVIGTDVKVVLVEGNYVGLKDDPWCRIGELADELWLVNTPTTLVRKRIIKRHLDSGIAENEAEAVERADGLDWQNALYVIANNREADVIVERN